tara:strand:+ start:1326 stop:1493 length:168 start_codon:yes stop_codon:yes gene_type:complete
MMDWKKKVMDFEEENPLITKKIDEAIKSKNYKLFTNKKMFLNYIKTLGEDNEITE